MAFDLAAFQALMAANTIPDIDLDAIDLSENYADIEPAPQPTEEEQLEALQAYTASNGPIVDLGLGDGSALADGLGYGDSSIVGDEFGITTPESVELLTQEEADGLHLSDEDFTAKLLEEAATARSALYDRVINDPSSLEGMSLSQQLTFLYENNQRNGGTEAEYLEAANEIVDASGVPRERLTDITGSNTLSTAYQKSELNLLPSSTGQIGVYGPSEFVYTPPDRSGGVFDTIMRVAAAIPSPFQPFAQGYVAIEGVSDGEITLQDALALAGVVNENPLSGFTDGVNSALNIDPESAFALTDDVLVNLAEGDLQGAALDYANADMVDVDLDSSIGNALASLDDNVIQPIASLGNELLDPFTGVLEPLSDIGSGINDAAQPLIEAASSVEDAVVATGDAIQTVADPIIDPIVAMGDVVQENIIDPAVQLASNFEDAARTPITAVGDAIQTVADPVIQAVNTVGDAAQENIIDPVVAVGDVVQDVVIDPVVAVGDVVQDVVIDPIVDVAAQVEDVVSEAIPSLPDTPDLSDIEYPDINIPTPDLSFIPTLFSDLLASTGTTATDTTDMKSLFSDDLFKFKNEIITV
jgi:hypothetical protein